MCDVHDVIQKKFIYWTVSVSLLEENNFPMILKLLFIDKLLLLYTLPQKGTLFR